MTNILASRGPFDFAVCLGDITSFEDRGVAAHPSCIKLLQETREQLHQYGKTVLVVPGNHDLGTPSPILGSGLSAESLEAFARVFGGLWWIREVQGVALIGLSSSLLEQASSHPAVLTLAGAQEEFLRHVLGNLGTSPWILFVHDPVSLRYVSDLIAPHVRNLCAVVHGGYHHPILGRWPRIVGVASTPIRVLLPKELRVLTRVFGKSIFCPALGPAWSPGYRAVILQIARSNNRIRIDVEHIDRHDLAIKELPAASIVKSTIWRWKAGKFLRRRAT